MPAKQTRDAAAYDVYCPEEIRISAGSIQLVDLGFSTILPPGFYARLQSRSGLALQYNVFCFGGIIDRGKNFYKE